MKLIYFAWLRERIGHGEETAVLPPGITTVAELVSWLRGRGEGYARAFAQPDIVRAAIDRRHSRPDTPLAGAREIAFFPPMTGG
ncbi:molybdopterin converting factor subunit 1 [Chelatococcus asaccharovorans]|uniref:molybdopterin converting factor subunit 1 n=1 Tax=Chelatococcus asaccharovorans TaxID=28210 RepID=UPI000D765705|nr:molybdopterin converting factor subunit 1 [Chelatococcus asaccharovorans]MBS7704422.1 molybdopterin converting factor subunit 1 [Chelatococcus asaccharovorans]